MMDYINDVTIVIIFEVNPIQVMLSIDADFVDNLLIRSDATIIVPHRFGSLWVSI